MLAMIEKPRNANQILRNLRVAFDNNWLLQPSFYTTDVLLQFFGGTSAKPLEGHPLPPGVTLQTIAKPARVTIVTVDIGPLSGMSVVVGRRHSCKNGHIDVVRPHRFIASHTYEAGFIELSTKGLAGFTVGAVKRAFGPHPSEQIPSLGQPGYLSYPPANSEDAFRDEKTFLDRAAVFVPMQTGREPNSLFEDHRSVFDDGAAIRRVKIEIVENDHTVPSTIYP